MHIRVDRHSSNEEATLSKIYLDGDFFCYGLEDQYQEVKVPGETRIPAGTYNIILRTDGGMTKRYAERYAFHQGMLHVRYVPGFTYVYIHTGNTDDHTDGCLLVGEFQDEEKFTISSSRFAYTRLYRAVIDAAAADELTITYEDNDE
jgi:hypothetical protein